MKPHKYIRHLHCIKIMLKLQSCHPDLQGASPCVRWFCASQGRMLEADTRVTAQTGSGGAVLVYRLQSECNTPSGGVCFCSRNPPSGGSCTTTARKKQITYQPTSGPGSRRRLHCEWLFSYGTRKVVSKGPQFSFSDSKGKRERLKGLTDTTQRCGSALLNYPKAGVKNQRQPADGFSAVLFCKPHSY